jgi:stage III sporulation protein SpoIIIAA
MANSAIKSTNGNLFVKDISTGDSYVQLLTPRQRGAIKVVTSPVTYDIDPATDYTVIVAAGCTRVNVPGPNTIPDGTEYTIKNISGITITIGIFVEGVTEPTIVDTQAVTFRNFNNAWYTISTYKSPL